jgi:hypothetical protein
MMVMPEGKTRWLCTNCASSHPCDSEIGDVVGSEGILLQNAILVPSPIGQKVPAQNLQRLVPIPDLKLASRLIDRIHRGARQPNWPPLISRTSQALPSHCGLNLHPSIAAFCPRNDPALLLGAMIDVQYANFILVIGIPLDARVFALDKIDCSPVRDQLIVYRRNVSKGRVGPVFCQSSAFVISLDHVTIGTRQAAMAQHPQEEVLLATKKF